MEARWTSKRPPHPHPSPSSYAIWRKRMGETGDRCIQLQRSTFWVRGIANNVRRLTCHVPCSLTGLNFSRMTLRDSINIYINIYIIRYKLGKNLCEEHHVERKKFFLSYFVAFVFIHGIFTFLYAADFFFLFFCFSALKRKVRERLL